MPTPEFDEQEVTPVPSAFTAPTDAVMKLKAQYDAETKEKRVWRLAELAARIAGGMVDPFTTDHEGIAKSSVRIASLILEEANALPD